MKISVIIPFHAHIDRLKFCLDGVLACSELIHEIIVVANNSDEEILNTVHELPANVCTLIKVRENLGYPGAINKGAAEAEGDVLIFCDDDVQPLPGWLPPHAEFHATVPNAGVSGARLRDQETGRIWSHGIGVTTATLYHPYRDRPNDYPLCDSDMDMQLICSALMGIRRSVFLGLGGYDTHFRYYYSDPDLCARALRSGLCNRVLRQSEAIHRGNIAATTRFQTFHSQREDFFKRHRGCLENDLERFFHLECMEGIGAEKQKQKVCFVNLSHYEECDDYIDIINKHFNIEVNYRIKPLTYNTQYIPLTDILPHSIANYAMPIIYHVDRYYPLKENYAWKRLRRNHKDIVVDRYANAVYLQDITELGP